VCTKDMSGLVEEFHDKCHEGELPDSLSKTCPDSPMVGSIGSNVTITVFFE